MRLAYDVTIGWARSYFPNAFPDLDFSGFAKLPPVCLELRRMVLSGVHFEI